MKNEGKAKQAKGEDEDTGEEKKEGSEKTSTR